MIPLAVGSSLRSFVPVAFAASLLAPIGRAQVFAPAKSIPGSSAVPSAVFAGDLDGDGDLDVVTSANLDNTVAWHENLGSGLFGPQVVISTSALNVFDVFAADFDGDGDVDVASASVDDDKLAWYENQGTGGAWPEHIISQTATRAHQVIGTDFDSDGDVDIVALGVDLSTGTKVIRHENLGGGVFGGGTSAPTTLSVARIEEGDFEQDGYVDIAAVAENGQVYLWSDFGAGILVSSTFIGAGPGFGQTLTTADVNGDGRLDIITPHVFGFLWLENQPGASSFQAHANFIPGFSVYNRILAGDLDRDGDVDVVLTTFSGSLFVMNKGDGLFDPPQPLGDHFGEGILVDLDLDGDLDLLASRIQGGVPGVFWQENIVVVDCNGNGVHDSLDIATGASVDCDGNLTPDECDLMQLGADIDADGKLDSCVAPPLMADVYQLSLGHGGQQSFQLRSPAAGSLYVLLGSASGTNPGLPVGGLTLPLNSDAYLAHTFTYPNGAPLFASFGVTMPGPIGGAATANFSLPPGFAPAITGLTVHHAFATFDPANGQVTFVSNPVPLALLP